MNAHRKRGFTLIELLVVIAIIAILAAILFPVFAQAKVAAKKAGAISNMKQTILAAIMYADSSDDIVNPRFRNGFGPTNKGMDPSDGVSFEYFLHPYSKSTELISSSADPGPKYQTPIGTYRRSYAPAGNAFKGVQLSDNISHGQALNVSKSLTWFPESAKTVAFGERRIIDPATADPKFWYKQGWTANAWMLNSRMYPQPTDCWFGAETWLKKEQGVSAPYNGGSVWAFMDGHAAYKVASGKVKRATGNNCLSTVFEGYETKAASWDSQGANFPEYTGGVACFDAEFYISAETNPVDPKICRVPGEN